MVVLSDLSIRIVRLFQGLRDLNLGCVEKSHELYQRLILGIHTCTNGHHPTDIDFLPFILMNKVTFIFNNNIIFINK
jgi:hypothetical protein